MKIIAVLVFLVIHSLLFSQRLPQDFTVEMPPSSLAGKEDYTLSFLDSRPDTSDMGFVLTGATRSRTKVIASVPLASQLSTAVKPATGSVAQNILFQLRRLQFIQTINVGSESGYCFFRASLYEKKNDAYYSTGFIDTVLEVKSYNAERPLFEKTSGCISTFISSHAKRESLSRQPLSYRDVVMIDSIEKNGIPLYQASVYPDGYYLTFSAFKNLNPDGVIDVQMKDGNPAVLKTTGRKGGFTKFVYSSGVYAIVFKGKPYIATDYGFCGLEKANTDFVFTGKFSISQTGLPSLDANQVFFVFKPTIREERFAVFYQMKLDHLTGQFIILKEIKR